MRANIARSPNRDVREIRQEINRFVGHAEEVSDGDEIAGRSELERAFSGHAKSAALTQPLQNLIELELANNIKRFGCRHEESKPYGAPSRIGGNPLGNHGETACVTTGASRKKRGTNCDSRIWLRVNPRTESGPVKLIV